MKGGAAARGKGCFLEDAAEQGAEGRERGDDNADELLNAEN